MLGADLISRMAENGVIANIQPSFVPTGGRLFLMCFVLFVVCILVCVCVCVLLFFAFTCSVFLCIVVHVVYVLCLF